MTDTVLRDLHQRAADLLGDLGQANHENEHGRTSWAAECGGQPCIDVRGTIRELLDADAPEAPAAVTEWQVVLLDALPGAECEVRGQHAEREDAEIAAEAYRRMYDRAAYGGQVDVVAVEVIR
jgi:hypothetical protein